VVGHNPNIETNPAVTNLSVGLGDSLNLILLLDGERVGGFLGAVHDLISQALGTRLDVSEGAVSSTLSDQGDSLVDSSKWGDINSLSSDNTTRSDTGGIFSSTTVLDGINKNLDGVLIGQKVNNLERLLDDSDSQLLLTVVSTLHHHGVDESLNNWAGGLSESLLLVATSSVGKIHSG
jgi:hypothetical protein